MGKRLEEQRKCVEQLTKRVEDLQKQNSKLSAEMLRMLEGTGIDTPPSAGPMRDASMHW
jgi:hypothetical protein